ncbi:2-C-methyl-D-erythritol 4-phosphate cytidylyltransferase [bacterium]|nr:2-C-methyl-D-erythritol 4-phosphate cytidylyltransferase [bacterium]
MTGAGSPQRVFGIVLAAGQGTRLGSALPKAFVSVGEETLLSLSLARLQREVSFEKVFIPYPDGYGDRCREVLEGSSLLKGSLRGSYELCQGGDTRQQSVWAALQRVSEEVDEEGERAVVLIHDAARCLVDPSSVRRVVDAASLHGAATLGLPQTDSLKRVEPETSVAEETVSRAGLWRIQTPQVFEFAHIFRAHREAVEAQEPPTATDDADLVQRFCPVRVVLGAEQNLKVTTPWDLDLVRMLVGGSNGPSSAV